MCGWAGGCYLVAELFIYNSFSELGCDNVTAMWFWVGFVRGWSQGAWIRPGWAWLRLIGLGVLQADAHICAVYQPRECGGQSPL